MMDSGVSVMRQRGDLFGALLLHPPLALQAVGQLSAHRLHGMQRGGKLSQTCAVCVNALGLLRSDGIHARCRQAVSAAKTRTVQWVCQPAMR